MSETVQKTSNFNTGEFLGKLAMGLFETGQNYVAARENRMLVEAQTRLQTTGSVTAPAGGPAPVAVSPTGYNIGGVQVSQTAAIIGVVVVAALVVFVAVR